MLKVQDFEHKNASLVQYQRTIQALEEKDQNYQREIKDLNRLYQDLQLQLQEAKNEALELRRQKNDSAKKVHQRAGSLSQSGAEIQVKSFQIPEQQRYSIEPDQGLGLQRQSHHQQFGPLNHPRQSSVGVALAKSHSPRKIFEPIVRHDNLQNSKTGVLTQSNQNFIGVPQPTSNYNSQLSVSGKMQLQQSRKKNIFENSDQQRTELDRIKSQNLNYQQQVSHFSSTGQQHQPSPLINLEEKRLLDLQFERDRLQKENEVVPFEFSDISSVKTFNNQEKSQLNYNNHSILEQ